WQAELRTCIGPAPSGVITAGRPGGVGGWSRQAERMFGWTPEEAPGRRLGRTIVPSRFPRARERGIARYRQTGGGRLLGKTTEIPAQHRDGHEFPVELTISPGWRVAGRAIVVGFVQDVSERKHADRLRNAEYA